MGAAVFVYGTLMAPEVLDALILRVPPSVPGEFNFRAPPPSTRRAPASASSVSISPQGRTHPSPSTLPARLPDHRRHRLRAHVFPAAVPCPGASIAGLLLTGLSPAEQAVLDAFEGEEYRKARAEVLQGAAAAAASPSSSSTTTPAEVYLWQPALADQLLPSPPDWSYEAFREAHLTKYVLMAAAFGEEARAAVGGDGGGGWAGVGAAGRAAGLVEGV